MAHDLSHHHHGHHHHGHHHHGHHHGHGCHGPPPQPEVVVITQQVPVPAPVVYPMGAQAPPPPSNYPIGAQAPPPAGKNYSLHGRCIARRIGAQAAPATHWEDSLLTSWTDFTFG